MKKFYRKCISMVLASMLAMGVFLYAAPRPAAEAITIGDLERAQNVLNKLALLSQEQAQQAVSIAESMINSGSWLGATEKNKLLSIGLTRSEVDDALNAIKTAIDNLATWEDMKSGNYATVQNVLNDAKARIGSDTVQQLQAKGVTTDNLILAALDVINVQFWDWSNLPQDAINQIFDSRSPTLSRATAEQYGLSWANVQEMINSLTSTQKTQLQSIVITMGNASSAQTQVAAAKTALTWFVVGGGNVSSSQVISWLSLPASLAGFSGVAISWATSNPAVVTTNGVVNRPAPGAANQTATLTATISKGFITDSKTFDITVPALPADIPTDVISQATTAVTTIAGSNNSSEIAATVTNIVSQVASAIGTGISEDAKLELVTTTVDTVIESLVQKMQGGVVTQSAVASQVNSLLNTVVNSVVESAANPDKSATVVASIMDTVVAKLDNSNITGDLKTNLNSAIQSVMEKVNTVQVASGQQVTDLSSNISQVVEKYSLLETKAGDKKDLFTAIDKKVKIDIPQTDTAEVTINAAAVGQLTSNSCDIQVKSGDNAAVRLPSTVLASKVTGDLNLKIVKDIVTVKPQDVQNSGDIYDLTLNSGGSQITQFGENVNVDLPYSGGGVSLKVYYQDAQGSWVLLTEQVTRTDTGVTFTTNHFTRFLVAEAVPSNGGGGGGGPIKQQPVNVISDSNLDAALAKASATGRVSLESSIAVGLTPAQLNKVEAAGKSLEVKINGVVYRLAPSALKAEGIDPARISYFQLGASEASALDRSAAENAKNGEAFSLAGKIMKLSAIARTEDGVETALEKFNGEVEVIMAVPEPAREAGEKGKLRACRFDETAAVWEPVDGQYDGSSYTFSFKTKGFSIWALMVQQDTTAAFTDIAGHWAKGDIGYMASRGYVSGRGGSIFDPDASITRAEFTAILVNILKPGVLGAVSPFSDVPSGAWYYDSVSQAYAAGLAKGISKNSFAPGAKITREQVAAMITNALKTRNALKEVKDVEGLLSRFADRGAISGWARTPSAQAVNQGILSGRPGGLFAPGDSATRAEATVMLRRMLNNL